ncbi:MAG: ABC transporter ATP-binding protein [Candidatus Hodarchaeota archaeon]|jgi:ABC-2 type transport system ATP-binding protein
MNNLRQKKSDTVLKVINLTKKFGQNTAVDQLNFEVFTGEIYGLLGPNGAGKSTTLKSILGLLEINSGRISVLGYDPITFSVQVKELIGYLPEESSLYESMTVKELLDFIISIRNLNPTTTHKVLDRLLTILNARKYYTSMIASLSKGNKRKIEIITTLLHRPQLLILDEPLSGLDTRSAVILKEVFRLHIQQGGSIVLSTHIMDLAQQLCTRIGIINNGTIIAEGSFEELQEKSNSTKSLEQLFLELTNQSETTSNIIQQLQQLPAIKGK